MSDGKSHDLHGLAVASFVSAMAAILYWTGESADIWALPAGILVGSWFLSPDLDMWKTGPVRRWGPLRFFWAPYSYWFTHRGWSHTWFVGPLSRIVYLGVPLLIVWYCYPVVSIGKWLGFLLLGIVVGNWIHLLGDRIMPWHSRRDI